MVEFGLGGGVSCVLRFCFLIHVVGQVTPLSEGKEKKKEGAE